MTDNEKAMYTGMAMSRNTEITLRWSRSQFFLIIHVALASVVGAAQQRGLLPLGLLTIACTVGILAGILWLLTNVRTNRWVQYWESRLRTVETTEPTPVTHGLYSGAEFEQLRTYTFTIRSVLSGMILSITIAWAVALVVELITL